MEVIELKDNALLCMKETVGHVVSKADDPDAPIVARVSTESVDSDGDIIHQGKTKGGLGWLLERFNRAPVMVWSHDIWMPNLASPKTKAKVGPDAEFGRSLFLNPAVFDEGDPFAMHIEGKVRRSVLKEWSVSFIGKIWELLRDSENDHVTGREFFEQELIETSPVNRGANPDTDAVAKRLLGEAYVKRQLVDAGDPSYREVLDELADAKSMVDTLTEAVKNLGGDVSSCRDDLAMLQEKRTQQGDAYGRAAGDLLTTMRKLGIAHD